MPPHGPQAGPNPKAASSPLVVVAHLEYLAWLERKSGLQLSCYGELWSWSVDRLEDFWQTVWDYYGVHSATPPGPPLAERVMPGARSFAGAQINYAEHVLSGATAERPALIAVDEAHDPAPVAAYAGNRPETVVAMLATTAIGAIWTACAPDFGTKSVLDRFSQVAPKVLVAVDG